MIASGIDWVWIPRFRIHTGKRAQSRKLLSRTALQEGRPERSQPPPIPRSGRSFPRVVYPIVRVFFGRYPTPEYALRSPVRHISSRWIGRYGFSRGCDYGKYADYGLTVPALCDRNVPNSCTPSGVAYPVTWRFRGTPGRCCDRRRRSLRWGCVTPNVGSGRGCRIRPAVSRYGRDSRSHRELNGDSTPTTPSRCPVPPAGTAHSPVGCREFREADDPVVPHSSPGRVINRAVFPEQSLRGPAWLQ